MARHHGMGRLNREIREAREDIREARAEIREARVEAGRGEFGQKVAEIVADFRSEVREFRQDVREAREEHGRGEFGQKLAEIVAELRSDMREIRERIQDAREEFGRGATDPVPPTDTTDGGATDPVPPTDTTDGGATDPTPPTDTTDGGATDPVPPTDTTDGGATDPVPPMDPAEPQPNILVGTADNDWFRVTGDYDGYDGIDGFDTLDFFAATQGVNVNLAAGTYNGQYLGSVENVEQVVGSNHDDIIVGDARANMLKGGNGSDWISGGAGADTLAGGIGNDTFAFQKSDVVASDGTHLGVDTITDFTTEDTLDLSDWFGGEIDPYSEPDKVDEAIKFRAEGNGTMVSVLTDGVYVDVVYLAGVSPGQPSAWASDSMLAI